MSTPSWYGSIGVMHARHLRRRRGLAEWMVDALTTGLRCLSGGRERPSRRRCVISNKPTAKRRQRVEAQLEAMRNK